MGNEVNNSFTEGQKNVNYKERLLQLKLKISQIILYDTKVALEFLQEYNEIEENEDMLGNNIIQRIDRLESKMQKYIRNDGEKKAFQESSKEILQSIEVLKIHSIQLTSDEFHNEFAKLKTGYEDNMGNYSFGDREKVERKIYELQASLIMRQVSEGKSSDEIQASITEHDKAGLTMFVLERINNLSQKEELKGIATKVNSIVMTDTDAVLRPELWSWLNVAERGMKCKEELQMSRPANTSTAMIVSPKNKNITLIDRILKVFRKEPTFPLQPIDLRKINIEWLSKFIPKSMLLELEDDRLSNENRQVNVRYVPDSKTVIYQLMRRISNMMGSNSEKEYKFIKENGSEFLVRVYEKQSGFIGRRTTIVEFNSGDIRKCGERVNYYRDENAVNETLAYASLLDKVFNTDIQQQLLQEVQDIYIAKKNKPTPVYDNLMLSLKRMLQEYHDTELDFEATEKANRKKFYERHGFKEQFKVEKDGDENKTEVKLQTDEQAIQPKDYDDVGAEQGKN